MITKPDANPRLGKRQVTDGTLQDAPITQSCEFGARAIGTILQTQEIPMLSPLLPIESELIHIGKHKKKKKFEFSKILVSWALLLTTLCVSFSYTLSFTDHDPASEVTVAVATACIAIAVAYEAKSFGEKNSRNKYGIEMNAHRTEQDEDDNEDAVG